MFQNLSPLSGGVGMKLMQKMGWQPGQVLGKRGEGYAEPIAVQVKIDRRGLSSNTEKATTKKTSVLDVQGNGMSFEWYQHLEMACLCNFVLLNCGAVLV